MENINRIAVIGAGAMGSLFGAMLSAAAEVVLIDPDREHMAAIRRDGVQIESGDGRLRSVSLAATTDPSQAETGFDLAIVMTKAWATREAARTARSVLRKDGLALTLQNGVGNREMIAEVLGPERVLAGVTAHGGTLLGPGRVRHAGRGPTRIAGGAEVPEAAAEQVMSVFRAAGIEVTLAENLDSTIWGKLIVNVGINALTALLRVPNGVLAEAPRCERILAQAVAEAVMVAEALGISLPYEYPVEHVKTVCRETAANRSSMLQDVLRGARTEVDVINRAVVRKGAAVGISTPWNQFLSEMIEALEATPDHRINGCD